MLEINYLRKNTDEAIERLAIRGIDSTESINNILSLDNERRQLQQQLDKILSEMNNLSKEIGELFKSGETGKANEKKQKTVALKSSSQSLKDKMKIIEGAILKELYLIPNTPNKDVPKGKSETDNQIISQDGIIPKLASSALPHWELASKYHLIDFELGVKITGAGFPVYIGKGARLQRALISFFLDEGIKSGYTEIMPPLLVNEASGYGTGQLPDKEGQMYHCEIDDYYLIPTAEVPITNLYRDVLLKESDLPVKNIGYTPCFRREAGSYGKDVRGLNRLHQFDKVEIVQINTPEKSYEALDSMVAHVRNLLKKLDLPFRIVKLCGGDLGFTSAITYDFEVMSAAQNKWLEVSSVSNFETFQSNRLKLRYKSSEGNNVLAHTLNGSALALPRILASILENNQDDNGIAIPKALIPYTRFERID